MSFLDWLANLFRPTPAAVPTAPIPAEPPRLPAAGQVAPSHDEGRAIADDPPVARVTVALLAQLGVKDAAGWAPVLDEACMAQGITTRLRLAAFLANVLHETLNLARLVESLDYRSDRLVLTFGAARISASQAADVGRIESDGRVVRAANQEAIANIVYGGTWGAANLGNTQPGDGWRFRGRGCMQTTGRWNYQALADAIGKPIEALPDLLVTKAGAADSAARFWVAKNCNSLADLGNIEVVRARINGGTNGLAEVRVLYSRVLGMLPG